MTHVLIGIGSNIDADRNIRECKRLLAHAWPGARFASLYRSPAMHRTDQPDFVNTAALIDTDEEPRMTQKKLSTMERDLKKETPYRFGPRTIDLDILLIGDTVIHSKTLMVPHPRMHERRFVLEPLTELIDPEKKHPLLQRSWHELLSNVQDQKCKKIAEI